jgi:hypothetical protein
MFSSTKTNFLDSCVNAAKSARDTLCRQFGNSADGIETTDLTESAETLKQEVTSKSRLPLAEEFAEFKTIVVKATGIFLEFKSMIDDWNKVKFRNGQSKMTFEEIGKTLDKEITPRYKEFEKKVAPIEKEIEDILKKMVQDSSTSWKKTAKHLLVGICAELALLTIGCAALLMTAVAAVVLTLKGNPLGVLASVAAAGTILTGMAASLAAIPVVAGAAIYNRLKPASGGASANLAK